MQNLQFPFLEPCNSFNLWVTAWCSAQGQGRGDGWRMKRGGGGVICRDKLWDPRLGTTSDSPERRSREKTPADKLSVTALRSNALTSARCHSDSAVTHKPPPPPPPCNKWGDRWREQLRGARGGPVLSSQLALFISYSLILECRDYIYFCILQQNNVIMLKRRNAIRKLHLFW